MFKESKESLHFIANFNGCTTFTENFKFDSEVPAAPPLDEVSEITEEVKTAYATEEASS